jgi:hypothetical protein
MNAASLATSLSIVDAFAGGPAGGGSRSVHDLGSHNGGVIATTAAGGGGGGGGSRQPSVYIHGNYNNGAPTAAFGPVSPRGAASPGPTAPAGHGYNVLPGAMDAHSAISSTSSRPHSNYASAVGGTSYGDGYEAVKYSSLGPTDKRRCTRYDFLLG